MVVLAKWMILAGDGCDSKAILARC